KSIPFKLKPEIAFNYLGRFGGGSKFDLFENAGLADALVGDEINPGYESEYKLHIEGVDAGGIFKLSFIYSRYEYKKTAIEKLAGLYKKNLLNIVAYCLAQKQGQKTPYDLGYNHISNEALEKIIRVIQRTSPTKKIKWLYPLTPLQHDIFYYSLQGKSLCFVQNLISIKGLVDRHLMEESIEFLFQKYDAPRSIFISEYSDKPIRIVLKERKANLGFKDITHLNPGEQESFLEKYKKEELKKGFDIKQDCLMRIKLFRTGKSQWKLLWNYHHILMNGYCFGIMFEDFIRIYQSRINGTPPQMKPATPFMSYRCWLDKQDREGAITYWARYLEDFTPQPFISPYGKKLNRKYKYESAAFGVSISELLSDAVKKKAAEARVTLTTLFKLIWATVLQRLTNHNDVSFGTVVSGRPPEVEEIQQIVGLLVNVIPVRIKLPASGNLLQILEQIQQQELISKNFEYLPLSEIETLKSTKTGWIDHLLVIENSPIEAQFKTINANMEYDFTLSNRKLPGFEIENLENDEQTNFDFTVGVEPGHRIRIAFVYNSLVYEAKFLKHVASIFKKVMREIVAAHSS
ncbi:MAG: hypothetical protein GY757_11745, partial [bacterium]|nr:hypothetical protein [bacterium]